MRAILTWKRFGEIVTEEVELIPPDHPVYAPVDGVLTELPINTNDMMDSGKVLFEDQRGIFGLDPEQIISVEVIGRNIYNAYYENHSTKEKIMNTVKKMASSTKNFVYKHRVSIAVVSTALVVGRMHQAELRNWDKFLADKGLEDEYVNNY